MKALTIWPEWAACIAAGIKLVEMRTPAPSAPSATRSVLTWTDCSTR